MSEIYANPHAGQDCGRHARIARMLVGDEADYQAMQARERYERTRKAGNCRAYLPMSALVTEIVHGGNLRELYNAGVIR
jgi:hypothetical protein